MTEICTIIELRRRAVTELDLLRTEIKTKYKDNPPVELLKALADLSKSYRIRYGHLPKVKIAESVTK